MTDLELHRHHEILDAGRTLLHGAESVVAFDSPFVLAAASDGAVFELAIRRVTAFAFLLSAVIGTLVVIRAAPLLIGMIVVVWLVGSVCARLFVRRRRNELGCTLIDFESGVVLARSLSGRRRRLSLDACHVRTTPSEDGDAPIWLLLVARPDGTPRETILRMARGREADVDRVLTVMRRHHVRVERRDLDPT